MLTKAKGNMYSWVTHLWDPLGGECPHQCPYCYVGKAPFVGRPQKYHGAVRLIDAEFGRPLGEGRTIFVCAKNDLFADGVERKDIESVLRMCMVYPGNNYVFQTKNPARMVEHEAELPKRCLVGVTLESNRWWPVSMGIAPEPRSRVVGMLMLDKRICRFVTVEPALVFDVDELSDWIIKIRPEFVNVGAATKCAALKLPEPSAGEVRELISRLRVAGIEVWEKSNLARLMMVK